MSGLKAPFPYFGGKSKVAHLVWERFGDVGHYIEPFAGSLAVLLARPHWRPGMHETVNDADGLLANFWRAMTQDPDAVIARADWPVSEVDMCARSNHLQREAASVTGRLLADPRWFDAELAGWWVWGQCASIPGSWPRKPGINAANRKLQGYQAPRGWTYTSQEGRKWLSLRDRLAGVQVMCGDWARAVSSPTRMGLVYGDWCPVGVFLDPPYGDTRAVCYATDCTSVHKSVTAWALEHGGDERLRICIAGYEGEHDTLECEGWSVEAWSTRGGMAHMGDGRGRANAKRERLWFSPHCLQPAQMGLFGAPS